MEKGLFSFSSGFVLGSREALEVILIAISIVAYLINSGRKRYVKVVWLAITAGVIVSSVGWLIFPHLIQQLPENIQEIIVGITLWMAAYLITGMVTYLVKRDKKLTLTERVDKTLSKKGVIGLFVLIFCATFREGIEVIVFLNATVLTQGSYAGIGTVSGIGSTIILTFIAKFLKGTETFSELFLDRFFLGSKVFLIGVASLFIIEGSHAFQEGGLLTNLEYFRIYSALIYIVVASCFVWWKYQKSNIPINILEAQSTT